jgi:RNA polymerase sigma-70 factor (ECF subfamily)
MQMKMNEESAAPRPIEEAEQILVERMKKNDREAFVTLTKMYQRSVYHLAYGFFRNQEDALDVVQETFFRCHQKIHLYQPGRSFKNWLLQIAKNMCIDYYRKNQKNDKEFNSGTPLDDIPVAADNGRDKENQSQLNAVFSKCLDDLTPKQRLVFVLKHYHQMKYKEIAQTLDIAVGTVKSLNFKAVNKMRELISPYIGRQGYEKL